MVGIYHTENDTLENIYKFGGHTFRDGSVD